MHAQPLRLEDVAREGTHRSLAVRAGHMNDRRQFALGMTKLSQQALDAVEHKINALGMKCQKPFEDCAASRVDAHVPVWARPLPLPFTLGAVGRVGLALIVSAADRVLGRGRFMSR